MTHTYYVKNGPTVTIILDERFKPTKDRIEGMRGKKFESHDILEFTAIETDDKNLAGNPGNYIVTNNIPSLMSQSEVDAKVLTNRKKEATEHAKHKANDMKENLSIVDGDTYEFNALAQTLFLAQHQTKDADIRIRRKGKKSAKVTKAKATAIFTKVSDRHNEIENALEADYEAIEAGNFDLDNLKTLES